MDNKIKEMDNGLNLMKHRLFYANQMVLYTINFISPLLVPFTPATFVGYSIYKVANNEMSSFLISLLVGVFSAFGLEAVGFVTSHTALRISLYRSRTGDGQGKMLLSYFLVLVYAMVAIAIVVYHQDHTFVVIGSGLVVLTIVTYLSQSLHQYVEHVENVERIVESSQKESKLKADEKEKRKEEKDYAYKIKQLELEYELKKKREEEKTRRHLKDQIDNSDSEKSETGKVGKSENDGLLAGNQKKSGKRLTRLKKAKVHFRNNNFTASEYKNVFNISQSTGYEDLSYFLNNGKVEKTGRKYKITLNGH